MSAKAQTSQLNSHIFSLEQENQMCRISKSNLSEEVHAPRSNGAVLHDENKLTQAQIDGLVIGKNGQNQPIGYERIAFAQNNQNARLQDQGKSCEARYNELKAKLEHCVPQSHPRGHERAQPQMGRPNQMAGRSTNPQWHYGSNFPHPNQGKFSGPYMNQN